MQVLSNNDAIKASGAWKFAKDMENGETGYVLPWNVEYEGDIYWISPYTLIFKIKKGTVQNIVTKIDDVYLVDTNNATDGIEINFSTPEKDKNKYIACYPLKP